VNEQDDSRVHVGIGFPTMAHVTAFEQSRQTKEMTSFLEVASGDSNTEFEVKALHWPLEQESQQEAAAFIEQKSTITARAGSKVASRLSANLRLQAMKPSQLANDGDGWAYGAAYAADGGIRFGSIIMKCGDNDRIKNVAGSIAGLLRDKVGGKYYAITAGHVIPQALPDANPADNLAAVCTLKDSADPKPKPFAKSKAAWSLRNDDYDVGGMQLDDAEVANMKCEWPAAANTYAEENVKVKGVVTGEPIEYLGREVMKVGPTTGVTFGKIWWLAYDAEVDFDEALEMYLKSRGEKKPAKVAAKKLELQAALDQAEKWKADWMANGDPVPNANMWNAADAAHYPDMNRFAGGQAGYDVIKNEYRSQDGMEPKKEVYLIREVNKPVPGGRHRGDVTHPYWGALDADLKFSGPGDSGSAILLKDTKQVVAFLQGGTLATRTVPGPAKYSLLHTAQGVTDGRNQGQYPPLKVPQFSFGVPAKRQVAKLNELTGLNLEFCKEHAGSILWGDEQPPKPKPLKRAASAPTLLPSQKDKK